MASIIFTFAPKAGEGSYEIERTVDPNIALVLTDSTKKLYIDLRPALGKLLTCLEREEFHPADNPSDPKRFGRLTLGKSLPEDIVNFTIKTIYDDENFSTETLKMADNNDGRMIMNYILNSEDSHSHLQIMVADCLEIIKAAVEQLANPQPEQNM